MHPQRRVTFHLPDGSQESCSDSGLGDHEPSSGASTSHPLPLGFPQEEYYEQASPNSRTEGDGNSDPESIQKCCVILLDNRYPANAGHLISALPCFQVQLLAADHSVPLVTTQAVGAKLVALWEVCLHNDVQNSVNLLDVVMKMRPLLHTAGRQLLIGGFPSLVKMAAFLVMLTCQIISKTEVAEIYSFNFISNSALAAGLGTSF
ncbi:hypothetical protein ASZ78_013536 [Callipepla squamata]|uniref:Uncharacterized protein n=1 Tax=Callipepla squamata TaxID=9009 RepID=A0A226NGL9_CALSU|nr:hypothetical protein ASZ78_013536 [Callipepla squamata]